MNQICICYSSDRGIKSIAPIKRNCLFPNEKQLNVFGNYSFSNCLLECYMGLASNVTQCVPWYLPRSNGSTLPSCDPWKTIQFRKEMSRIEPSQCSHCLSDCDSVKYFVTSSSNKFKYVIILLLIYPFHCMTRSTEWLFY